MSLDYELFRLINGIAGSVPLLDALMRLVVNEYFVPTTISLLLFGLWLWGETPKERAFLQRAVLLSIGTLALSGILVKACNLIYWRPRPFANHEVNLLFYRPTDSSFPSNPTTVGFAFATAIWLHERRLGAALYGLAALFGFSRIYCGVHYPTDVLGGILFGTGSGLIVHRYRQFLEPLVNLIISIGRRFFVA